MIELPEGWSRPHPETSPELAVKGRPQDRASHPRDQVIVTATPDEIEIEWEDDSESYLSTTTRRVAVPTALILALLGVTP
jgi:hypothetical protein